jgi:hypothetical protein
MIPSCKKTSELLSAQQDRPLGRLERIALGTHLALCRRCRIVARQLEFLRLAARRWRDLE